MPRVVKTLSEEDLGRWRNAVAGKEIVEAAYPGMSINEAKEALIRYYSTLGSILKDYEIDTEEDTVYVSPADGNVIKLDFS